MIPKIPGGSQVLIREQSEVEPGESAAVLINRDQEATLKNNQTRKNGPVAASQQ